jgi:RNA polymerase-binding transcription factor DksA
VSAPIIRIAPQTVAFLDHLAAMQRVIDAARVIAKDGIPSDDLVAALKTSRNVIATACGERAPFASIALAQIDETIAKIEAGDYGYCESCGVEIGLQRLQARPTASKCIDCKTLEELRERQVAK